MERLIDANALEQRAKVIYMDVGNVVVSKRVVTVADIYLSPTIDAVPVVHCKDCKHWGEIWAPGTTEHIKCCAWAKWFVGGNGYCVYGERKDDDE